MALGAPLDVRLLVIGGCAPGAAGSAAAADRRRHHVVHVEPDPDEPVRPSAVERRHDERQRLDEMRGELDHQPALEQRLADEPEVEVLQVPQAAVDELRGPAARPRREVRLLDERDAVPAGRGVERHAGAGDPAPNDHDVEPFPGQRLDCPLATQHRLASLLVHRVRGRAPGVGFGSCGE